jgi:hypothetical protein
MLDDHEPTAVVGRQHFIHFWRDVSGGIILDTDFLAMVNIGFGL